MPSLKKPHGILPAVITPFDARERIDYSAWKRVIDHQIGAGVHGLFFAGGQGEFFSLTSSERREIMRDCVAMVAGRVPVYMGVGAVTTRETIELALAAAEAKADYAVAITPYYLKPTQDELVEHYAAVLNEAPIPLLAYNIPERTGNELAPETARRIAEKFERFIGLKDSSGDLDKVRRFVRIEQEIGRPFAIFMGRDHMILPALQLGAVGAVAACGNVIPELLVELYEAFRRGDIARADECQERVKPLRAAFTMGTFPSVIKEAMEIAGLPGGRCRRPVGPLSAEEREKLRKIVIETLGSRATAPVGD